VRLGYGIEQVLVTRRGRSLFALSVLSAFGLVSALIGFLAAVFDAFPDRPMVIAGVALGACVVWGLGRTYPRARLEHEFSQPEMVVRVIVGDLFDQDTHLVIGFSDTFDTSTHGDRVISKASAQGQLVDRYYDGDAGRLDRVLRSALGDVAPLTTESRTEKRRGKLQRYPMGTVAVLGDHPRLIFAVAVSRMGNDLIAHSSVDDLWHSLGQVWEAVRGRGQRSAVSIPLVGSGLSRVDALDRNNLARMILLSFVAHSRQALVARELRIVIHPDDVERIDMIAVNAFLRTL
jgi:hypothetical protein